MGQVQQKIAIKRRFFFTNFSMLKSNLILEFKSFLFIIVNMKNKYLLSLILILPCVSGCSGEKEDYKYLGPVAPYLHELVYDDYEFDEDRLTIQDYLPSCSVVRNGNFVGRNFDFYFNDVPEFIVHVKAKEGRYASIGVAQTTLFTETDLLSNNYNKDYFKLIPNMMMDGINEKGVFVCNNVVANEGVLNLGTDSTKEELGVWFITRKILDHASSADEAVEIMKSYNLVGDLYGIENLHFMIVDANKTYVAEIIDTKLVIQEKTGDEQIMTNFLVNQEELNNHPSGLERYNILKENYVLGSTFKGMQDLLYKARFSLSFNPNNNPLWVSDAGFYTYDQILSGEAAISYKEILESEMYDQFTYDFTHNIRCDDPSEAWWITVSNSTYDIQNRSFKIFVQENYSQCFEFRIES